MQQIRKRPLIALLAALGAAIHGGTALLRLSTFWPYPHTVDFASFYVGAWATRLHTSIYPFSADLLDLLKAEQGLTVSPAVLNSFPIWPWLLQPLTLVTFPAAAWIWLCFNLALLVWITGRLAQTAQLTGGWTLLVLFGVVLTFGPVMLTLTLGQSSIWLTALSLWLGRRLAQTQLSASSERSTVIDIIGWIGAVSTKLFPVLWGAGFVVLQRWRSLWGAVAAALAFVGVHLLFLRQTTLVYLTEFLPSRTQVFSTGAFVDDQSLLAWLSRMTQPALVTVSGVSATEQTAVIWQPALAIPAPVVQIVGVGVLALLGVAVIYTIRRARPAAHESAFYLWILFCLLPFPHTERYNHTLLLPGMAVLWAQGARGQRMAAAAYFLAALSRLTHLWAQILPSPLASLLSGSGLFAVCVLMWGIWRTHPRANTQDALTRAP
ncbi:MAG: glycosyltransferase family 87 protein [Caldilineaceae bacterium]|nr:DUF2029 domain-containing protein [Caldilineaceae bacterium]